MNTIKNDFYTDKHEICTLPSPAAPGALFLPFIHVSRFSRSSRFSLLPVADIIFPRPTTSRVRAAWMAREERREQTRDNLLLSGEETDREERQREGEGAALL